ncbi:MAG TPA: helix-turn-helix domain-containing protein, partial [Actinospica sp.]|nr:helix-turn-helix domain-containing protein [Actinospica sp.]
MTDAPSPAGAASGAEGHAVLRRWAAGDGPQALRASIVLLAAQGLRSADIARRLGVSRQTVATWRQRYAVEGPDGLLDRARPGRPAGVDEGEIVVGVLTAAPDDRTSRLLARKLGCSHTVVAETRRRWNLTGSRLAVPRIPMNPALEAGDLWPVGLHLDAECTLLMFAGRALSPVPPPRDPVVDGYALAAVAGAMADAVAASADRPAQAAPDPDGAEYFLDAVRRTHPQSELHAVVLRPRSSPPAPGSSAAARGPARPVLRPASVVESCARLEITAHQRPDRISEVSFVHAVLALDAARHPESSTRVLLDLAAALARYAAGPERTRVRWIREPLPAVVTSAAWPGQPAAAPTAIPASRHAPVIAPGVVPQAALANAP